MATSIQRKKVKLQRTPAQIAADKAEQEMAEKEALLAEWSEYVDDLVASVQGGDLDLWLERITEVVSLRAADIGLYDDDVEKEAAELAARDQTMYPPLSGGALIPPMSITTTSASNKYDLVGKDVVLNSTISPRWAAGLRVRVIRANPKSALVQWVDDPKQYSSSGLAMAKSFRCAYSLFDINWINGYPL